MNDPLDTPPPRFGWIQPRWFLGGLALGLAALAVLGWSAARTDYHPGFQRFYPPISPETSYYPTLDEMKAIVRGRCRPGQVLVIVGGNSILEGVWQPSDDLWSDHLQELLGERYCVVNFAFRGAQPTDGGAVVAEALRREFPHQVYIANAAPFDRVDPLGHDPYRYLFWQAYFSGQLIRTPARAREIAAFRAGRGNRAVLAEAAIAEWFDCILHSRDLWNRVAFDYFCTVPSPLGEYFPALITPRRMFPDAEPDAYDPEFKKIRYPAASLGAEMAIVRNFTGLFLVRAANGGWRSTPRVRMTSLLDHLEAFPPPLVGRTILLISRNSPHYLADLSAAERLREDLGYREGVRLWRQAGYPAMQYGRDYGEDDFGDRTHLSKTGGRKLAADVAPQVRAVAERLGYLR